jgi:hypothetical protein
MTSYVGIERQAWFRDDDRVLSRIQHEGETRLLTLEWSGRAEFSGTISTSTWESGGITLSGAGTSGTTTYATIAGTSGWARNTLTDSAGRIFVEDRRFHAPPSGRASDDYGQT